MKKIVLVTVCVSVGVCMAGCQNTQTRATEGAVIGGIIGATAGGIIGHQSRHGGEGAAIGAAAGILSGAVLGSQVNKPTQPSQGNPVQTAPASQNINPQQMSIQQVVELTKQGIHEDVIIDKMRLSNSRFVLTGDDTQYLKQQGVSEKVINAMQSM
jgi:outer membrane lipoprotein SlyB